MDDSEQFDRIWSEALEKFSSNLGAYAEFREELPRLESAVNAAYMITHSDAAKASDEGMIDPSNVHSNYCCHVGAVIRHLALLLVQIVEMEVF